MAEYQLYCMAESGNAYKAALALTLSGLDWEPIKVDFFNGQTRTDSFREEVNEMGEVPVLAHGDIKISQSGVILDYVAKQSGKFGGTDDAHKREILRWILFDNHKFTSYIATLRFMAHFMKSKDQAVLDFVRARAETALKIVDKHLGSTEFIAGNDITIADMSLCGYLFFGDELNLSLEPYRNIDAWLERIKSQDGWKHPYDLMPAAYEG